jgi:tRNA pseudouridine38-40 synthase
MRYFIEVSYDGTGWAGFQVQENAATVQGEVERVLETKFRRAFQLTGSSRTDAGVHARQNFFHTDTDLMIDAAHVYNLNALLPRSIAIKNIVPVAAEAHARFDAVSRQYVYYITTQKDPFWQGRAWHYPYPIDKSLLDTAASVVLRQRNFVNYAKRHAQVKTTLCTIEESVWAVEEDRYTYRVRANRFLRGMVRALVASMLRVGRGQWSPEFFERSFDPEGGVAADFAAPGWGLYLERVAYPEEIFKKK